ncbi:MAG: hypothetical protein ABIP30_10210 [Ferruginibacter sp.]
MTDEVFALHQKAKRLIKESHDEEHVIAELVKEGVSQSYAQMIIENILSEIRDRKDFLKMFIMALFTISGGLLLNYMSYGIAVRNGAIYMLIFWGIMVSGIIMLIKALSMYRNLPRY